jgi:MFS family permease
VTLEAGAPRSLWRHPEFLRLWMAESISQVGTQVTLLALPLVAIALLGASTLEVALLGAFELLPFALFGLPAGAWIDRRRKRWLLVVGDVGRAAALASVPAAHALGALSMAQLYTVGFVVGTFTVLFDITYEAYLPQLVARDQLVEGYAKLELSRSGATVAGPTLAGALIAATSASIAVIADALSYLLSAACLLRIRRPERAPVGEVGEAPALGREIREGLRYVVHHPVLRALAAATATSNLFASMATAVTLLYLARQLGVSPGELGVIFGVGNLGLVAGALLARRAAAALGLGAALIHSLIACSAAALLVPAAPAALAPIAVALAQLISGFGTTIYNVHQVSLRQGIAPPPLRARINATMRFAVWGPIPLGALLGGLAGEGLGLVTTLWLAAIGGLTAPLWLMRSPVRALSVMPPEASADADAYSLASPSLPSSHEAMGA